MTDPIISPWFIYLITRVDDIKCFLNLFPLMFLISALLIALLIAFMRTLAGDFEDYGECYVRNVIKVGLITIPLTIILNLFIPSTKVLATMYVADKLTISNIQMVGETADKVVDKAVEKVIKVIEATKEKKE